MKYIILTLLIISFFCSEISAQSITANQNHALLQALRGDCVNLGGFLTEKLPLIDYSTIVLPGPQYIISDDPEYIKIPEAIAVREKVKPGSVRLYVYNVNGIEVPAKIDRKITAVIKNQGTENMHLLMLKYSSQKPSANYYQIAKMGLTDYFASMLQSDPIVIMPGAMAPIDAQLEKNVVKYDELVHGIYEFVIDQPGEISVVQTDPQSSGAEAALRIDTIHPSSYTNAGRAAIGAGGWQM